MAIFLDYLAQPNPAINDDQSLKGLPTRWEPSENLTVTEWKDFTYDSLMNSFGDVLRAQMSSSLPRTLPSLTALEREIFDENSLDHLPTRSVMAEVSTALQNAWSRCYPNETRPIDITRGGRARNPDENTPTPGSTRQSTPAKYEQQITDPRKLFPDWAGVRKAHSLRTYINRCPGDTKLSGKWTPTASDRRPKSSYWWPIAQLLYYCNTWRTRYGYLITQEELVVFRLSGDPIGPGLAENRSPRFGTTTPSPPRHPLGSSPPWPSTTLGSSPHRGPIDKRSISLSPSARQQGRERTGSVASSTSSMLVDPANSPSLTGSLSQAHQRSGSNFSGQSNRMAIDSPQGNPRDFSLSDSTQTTSNRTTSYRDDGRGSH